MEILAHRGLGFNKPENSIESLRKTLNTGCGLEIDVRLNSKSEVVISHDLPNVLSVKLDNVLDLLLDSQEIKAIHLKEDRIELWRQVCERLKSCPSVFLFDVTIKTARQIKKEFPGFKLGFSVSEDHFLPTTYFLDEVLNLPECDIIWWDEWMGFGKVYNEVQIRKIKKTGRKIYAVSPELHKNTIPSHQYAANPEFIWKKLIDLGVDGICTDYPIQLSKFLKNKL